MITTNSALHTLMVIYHCPPHPCSLILLFHIYKYRLISVTTFIQQSFMRVLNCPYLRYIGGLSHGNMESICYIKLI